MAVEFYDINDIHHQSRLFEISHDDFDDLNEILSKFKDLTGIWVDAYGKTRLYENHVKLIASMIKTRLDKLNPKGINPTRDSLLNTYNKLSNSESGLLIIGD